MSQFVYIDETNDLYSSCMSVFPDDATTVTNLSDPLHPYNLKDTTQKDTQQMSEICSLCGQMFSNDVNLQQHRKTVHQIAVSVGTEATKELKINASLSDSVQQSMDSRGRITSEIYMSSV